MYTCIEYVAIGVNIANIILLRLGVNVATTNMVSLLTRGEWDEEVYGWCIILVMLMWVDYKTCLLYTSDAADE